MRYTIFSLFLFSMLLQVSCSGGEKRTHVDPIQSDTNAFTVDLQEGQIDESILALFPAPGEILAQYSQAELQYLPGITLPVDQADSYLSSDAQAMNLGVYITDLAYSAKMGRANEAIEILNVIFRLGNEVGVSSAVFTLLITRAKKNIESKDTLVQLSNEAFFNLNRFLESNKKENTFALITVGAYVEGIYILTSAIEDYNEEDPAIQKLSDLRLPFENVLTRVLDNNEDPDVEKASNHIKKIMGIFEQLSSKDSETLVEVMGDGNLKIEGGTDYYMSQADFSRLKNLVSDIRKEITGEQ